MKEAVHNSVGFRIAHTANRINQAITTLLNEEGIAPEQRILLEILSSCEKANQTTLATMLNKSPTTVSRTLDSLEKKGLIIKKEVLGDKRANLIEVTAEGKAMLARTETIVNAFRQNLSNLFTPEEKQTLFALLEKIS
ncbi:MULTISPECIES: MarR family transcriptional regulator [unclassified Sulfurospirillum]|uniref:MarR family winged helix-turn-helix transcriptional regulator n=1 Tax=unclassified Sulfurospirillum TaxID=2618290 RepID=UPI000690A161|nr:MULTISPECIES: MarR family transcriptional regulator [unclassified Sulfurospirillum]